MPTYQYFFDIAYTKRNTRYLEGWVKTVSHDPNADETTIATSLRRDLCIYFSRRHRSAAALEHITYRERKEVQNA